MRFRQMVELVDVPIERMDASVMTDQRQDFDDKSRTNLMTNQRLFE